MAPWLVPRSLCPRRPRACGIVTFSCGERDRTRFIPAQPRALWPANRGSSTKSCITSSASLALNFVPSRSARVLSSLRSVAAARFRASRSSAFICSTVLCVDSSVFYVFGTRTWPASSTMPVLSFAMTAVWASAAHTPLILPTAGNMPNRPAQCPTLAVHPRVRGKHRAWRRKALRFVGSSARASETHHTRRARESCGRSLPVRAGVDGHGPSLALLGLVNPRLGAARAGFSPHS